MRRQVHSGGRPVRARGTERRGAEPGTRPGHSHLGDDGIELTEDRYALYIDESGRTWSRGNRGGGYYVVAGILAHQDRINDVYARCRDVLTRYTGLDPVPELKFGDVMRGINDFSGIGEKKHQLAYDIFDIIRDEGMPIFPMAVGKIGYNRIPVSGYKNENHYATVGVIEAALGYASRFEARLWAVRDDGCRNVNLEIKAMVDDPNTKQDKPDYEYLLGFEPGDSVFSFGLQLADFCAGAVWRAMNCGRWDCYDRIASLKRTFLNPSVNTMFYPLIEDDVLGDDKWYVEPGHRGWIGRVYRRT